MPQNYSTAQVFRMYARKVPVEVYPVVAVVGIGLCLGMLSLPFI